MDPDKILFAIPDGLRNPLIQSYRKIAADYTENRWEPSELNGGKFSESVYWIVHGYLTGTYVTRPSKPANMVRACNDLEQIPEDTSRPGDRSLRILIPRMLLPLYEIRNNRGVGHIGGDVDPNFMDATAVYSMSSWVLAELIRIFHDVPTKDAQTLVDVLVERKHPMVWEVEGVKRVLEHGMPKADQTLLLLHSSVSWVSDKELGKWIEYSNLSLFQSRILRPLHKERLVEYDEPGKRVRISPKGVEKVEKDILRSS